MQELPEQLKYYIKEMKNPSLNSGIRLQYKGIIQSIVTQLQKELSEFDTNLFFGGKSKVPDKRKTNGRK